MDVGLLVAVAGRLAAGGWASLRFDFRPDVGNGTPAVHDLAGALDTVAADGERLAIVGWSFGALVGLLLGPHDPRVTQWIGIAPPTRPLPEMAMLPPRADLQRWPARRDVIIGQLEQFFPDPSPAAPDHVHVVAGADHFFAGREEEVAEAVAACLS